MRNSKNETDSREAILQEYQVFSPEEIENFNYLAETVDGAAEQYLLKFPTNTVLVCETIEMPAKSILEQVRHINSLVDEAERTEILFDLLYGITTSKLWRDMDKEFRDTRFTFVRNLFHLSYAMVMEGHEIKPDAPFYKPVVVLQ